MCPQNIQATPMKDRVRMRRRCNSTRCWQLWCETNALFGLLSFSTIYKRLMTSLRTNIPGLFSLGLQSQSSGSTATMFSGSSSAQNSNENMDRLIHLRGSGLINELTEEKENLEERFVHSKRLIDDGKLRCSN